jgi:predicted RNA-binding protein YlxR (DUF448 family)
VAAELLRVVVAPEPIGKASTGPAAAADSGPSALSIVPDPRHRAPGRGAWLHRELECVELAERRRAFARALQVPAAIDPSPVREYVARAIGQPDHQE